VTGVVGPGPGGVEVPAGLADLTADWLTAALAAGGRLPGPPVVEEVRHERIGESTGFLGRLARLHVRYGAGSGPATLVAKLPTDDAGGRLVGRLLDVWNRESRFFAEVAPACGPQVPTCYYNGADAAAERWALLLEDRSPGQPADQLAGASPAQAEAAVDALADLQRRFRGRPPPFRWMPGFHRATFAALQGAMEAALPTFTSRYGERVPSRTLGWLTAFVDDLPTWAAEQGRAPLTLVHADYRLDNLTFAADGRVTILDWQTTLWGPGPMDLASFVATSLTVDDRRRQEQALLARYARGVGADVGEVEATYRSCLLWWMAIFANNLSRIDPADERGVRLFEHMIDRTFTAADDWDAGALLAN
jgi:aminoglycoside phosphotransferase (APT) family kinase protein